MIRAAAVLMWLWCGMALGQQAPPPRFDMTGQRVLHLFLSGQLAEIAPGIDAADDLAPGARALNLALAAALGGDYDRAGRFLQVARTADPAPPPGMLDMVQLIRTNWGTLHRPDDGLGARNRLLARRRDLSPDLVAAAEALALFNAYLAEDYDRARAALRLWQAGHAARVRAPTLWDVYATLPVVETAQALLPPDEADALMAAVAPDLAPFAGLDFARDFLDFTRHLNGTDAHQAEAALIALGTLLPRIRNAVTPWHTAAVSADFSYANALWAQQRRAAAIGVARDVLRRYADNPYARADVLAYIRAQLAAWLFHTGEPDAAWLLISESFDVVAAAARSGPGGTMRPSLIFGVIDSYFFILARREPVAVVVDRMAPYAFDAEFLAALTPALRYALLAQFAIHLADAGQPDEARAVFRAALSALDAAPPGMTFDDGPARRVYDEMVLEYRLGNLPRAVVLAAGAGDIYRDLRARAGLLRAQGVPLPRSEDRLYAFAEAYVAWDYVTALRAARARPRTGRP